MTKPLKRLLCIVILAFLISTNLQSNAQPEQASNGALPNNSAPQAAESEEQLKVKHTLAFQILGRELTQKEKASYGHDVSKEALKNILSGEQRLVIVRALVTVGAEKNTKDILNVYNISSLQTYAELIDYFGGLIEKYGSVKTGIESEYVYNIKDNEQAFKKAATKAYETVFGVPEDKQDKEQIYSFLTQSNAITYSKMLQVFMQTITPDIKKQILFNALDQSGRPDLKTNEEFVNKILEQTFTYENLIELFKELQTKTSDSK